ncbi:MAG: jacalin-like lectin [Acidobacteriota bacterium]
MYIWSGDLIDRIQLIYTLRDGSIFEGKRYGGGGGRRQVFQLADNEYITGISGRHGEVIDSIKIHTNRRTSDTYGGRGGARNFNITIPNGKQAIGLTGRAGEYLDAIGLEYIRSRESVQENPRRRQDRYRNWR